jgi:hypothetical protein
MQMPKLDVGVGDEFPAEEKGQIHHHHYHLEDRPYRLPRLILSIMLIVLTVRLASFAGSDPFWMEPTRAFFPAGLYTLGGLVAAIVVIGAVLCLLPRRNRR